jgi:hypothetical protein
LKNITLIKYHHLVEEPTEKFGPAVSQKELEKIINSGEAQFHPDDLKKMTVRIEIVAEFEDVKKLSDFLREHSRSST